MSATIQQTIDELRRSLTEYLEATYHIGHPRIIQQRRELLQETVSSAITKRAAEVAGRRIGNNARLIRLAGDLNGLGGCRGQA